MSKYTILILTIFNCELSWSRPHFKDELIRYESRQDPGPRGYTFRFESTKGVEKKETGNDGLRVHGFYGYRSPSGLEHLTYYKADENGFRAQENHKIIPQNMNFHDKDQAEMPISQIITSLPWYSNILKLEEYKTRSTTDYNFQEHILNNRDVEEEIITITTTNPIRSSTSEDINYNNPKSLVTEARFNEEGPSTDSPINEDLHTINTNESFSDPAASSLKAIGAITSRGEDEHSGDISLPDEKDDLGKFNINPTRESLKTQNVSIPSSSQIVATLPQNSVMFETTSTQNIDTPHSLDPSATTALPEKSVQMESTITSGPKVPIENVGAIRSTTTPPTESLAKSTLPEKILRSPTSTTIIPSEYSGMTTTTTTSEAMILSTDLLRSTKLGENTSMPKSNKILITTGSSDSALTTTIATIISENQKSESDQNSHSEDQSETEVTNFTIQNQNNSTSTLIPPDTIENNLEISSPAIASLAGG